jgi:hypothetical protein
MSPRDTDAESLPIVKIVEFLVLTLVFALASNLFVVFLVELGNFIAAVSVGGYSGQSFIVAKYFNQFPPFVWFTGYRASAGAGLVSQLSYVLPVVTVSIPLVATLAVRRLGNLMRGETTMIFLRTYFILWILEIFYFLGLSGVAVETLSDTTSLLWFANMFFYAAWWVASSYFVSRSMRLAFSSSRLIVLSLSTFALLYLAAVSASVLAFKV